MGAFEEKLNLGATGKYPQGKISENDEGELKVGITTVNNKIVVSFGKSVTWIGMTKEEALGLAEILTERANKL